MGSAPPPPRTEACVEHPQVVQPREEQSPKDPEVGDPLPIAAEALLPQQDAQQHGVVQEAQDGLPEAGHRVQARTEGVARRRGGQEKEEDGVSEVVVKPLPIEFLWMKK